MTITIRDILGVFDPYHYVIHPTPKQATDYMLEQARVFKDYRHWYYAVLDAGILTVTQIKKKGLYSEHALDEGVSTMGGKFPLLAMGGKPGGRGLPGVGIEDAPLPGVTNNDPGGNAYSPGEDAQVADNAAVLHEIYDDTMTKSKKNAHNARKRRREQLKEKLRLIKKLASLLDPENPTVVAYKDMTINELKDAISAATGAEEAKGEIPDEEKDYYDGTPADSSDALEDVERKMAFEENTSITKGQKIRQTKQRVKANDGDVSWGALRELIRSSITNEDMDHYGSFLIFTGGSTSQRTDTINMALSGIRQVPGSEQRMLDLLSSFGVWMRDTLNMTTRDAQSRVNRNRLARQFRRMSLSKKRELRVAFNKLFRNLVEERIYQLQEAGLNTTAKKATYKKMTDLLGDLASVTKEQMAGSLVAPDKPMTTGDFLEAENSQMVTVFTQLLAATGTTDSVISAAIRTLELKAERYHTLREREMREDDGVDTDTHEAQVNIQAEVYAEMVGEILTHIQALKNMLESRFVKDSSLRNAQNIFKLKRTLNLLIDEIKEGISQAQSIVSQPTLIKLRRLILNFKRLYDGISQSDTGANFTSSSDNPAGSQGGTEMTEFSARRDSGPSEQQMEEKYQDVEEKLDIRIQLSDTEKARRLLQVAANMGQDRVTATLMGNDISIASSRVPIRWSQIPAGDLREILSHRARRDAGQTGRGQYLLRERLGEIQIANLESLYGMSEFVFKSRQDRLDILNRYPDAKPRRPAGGPPEDPDEPPPGGDIILGWNGRQITLAIAALASLLVLLGMTTAEIVKLIKFGGSTTAKNPAVPDPTDIGTGGNNKNNNNDLHPIITPGKMPLFPRPNDPEYPVISTNPAGSINQGGNTDPIYGGIGNIQPRSEKFKAIKPPLIDAELGADYIEPDDNMMKNTALMTIVERYNSDVGSFNELIELRNDLTEVGDTLTADEMKDLESISIRMKNSIIAINQQSTVGYADSRTAAGKNYYGYPALEVESSSDRFTYKGQSINKVYPLISPDDNTQSLGLNDDIAKYNSMAEEYNQLSAMYKGYGQGYNVVGESAAVHEAHRQAYEDKMGSDPAYSAALKTAVTLEGKLNPLLAKINTVRSSPESSIGRDDARSVSYSPIQKSFIQKVQTGARFDSITEAEKKSMRDSPELYASYEKLVDWYKRSREPPYTMDQELYNTLIKEFIATKDRGFQLKSGMPDLKDADWSRVQKESQNEYIRSKQEFLSAVASMKQAKMSGATPHTLNGLYNDLETKRLHYEQSRGNYESMADNYKHALAGRTSFLADMTLERLPTTEGEVSKFDRLQTLERVIQHNPDAIKEYNDAVAAMPTGGFGSTATQVYGDREALLKSITGKYNLSTEYEDARTRNIHIKVDDAGEDPSTIVDFTPGKEDVGKSTERANFINPNERELFMTDKRDRLLEQKRWEDFSLVQPWNGLGDPRTNPLLDRQVQEYMTRYGNTTKGPTPTARDMRNLNRGKIIQSREQQPNYQTDFPFIPTIQATFGREAWEDEGAIPTNNFQSQQAVFTRSDNDLPNNQFNTWYPNQGSTYHPDRQIDMRNFNSAVGPLLTQNSNRRPVMYGITPAFNEQYGSQQTSFAGGATMNNNFGPLPNTINGRPVEPPQQKPNSIYDTLDRSCRRSMSMRR